MTSLRSTPVLPTPTAQPADLVAAHLLVQRALELAGKRLLTRERRGSYSGDVRRLHEQVKVSVLQLPRLLTGAFDWCDELEGMVTVDPVRFRAELADYVGGLLLAGQPHSTAYLPAVVAKAHR